MKRLLLPLMIALASPALLLGMSKKPGCVITFHTLAAPNDPPKTMFPFDLNGKRIYFKIVPEFSQENISAYKAFPAENGNGKGMAIQLDFRGKAALELITREHKDEYLLAMINAKPVDFVVMDEPVMDGMVTIWQGVTDDTIKEIAKKHPVIRSGAPTMSKDMDMLPTTKKEKEKFLEAQKKTDKVEAERLKKSGKKDIEVPNLNMPNAPTTPKIPVEGAAPSDNPQLPVPPQGQRVPYDPPLPSPTKP